MTTDMVEVELVLVTCLMSPYATWYWHDNTGVGTGCIDTIAMGGGDNY
jgi:hypothetical protein